MRRVTWILAIVIGLMAVLAGCGSKDAGSVVKDLSNKTSKLESYKGSGKMVLHTGEQPQEYQVEVWYQNPNFYRISLTNEEKDIRQIVLRNDDGVFVLTPHLNKSFRFQSDWPDNQGQVYLFQTLAQSIVNDNGRQFVDEDSAYVFDVAANYQNSGNLKRQKIWLDKKSLAPKHVKVSDENSKVIVELEFTQFEFDSKFDKNAFDMQRNMTTSNMNSLNLAPDENVLGESKENTEQTDKTEPGKPDESKKDDKRPSGSPAPSNAPGEKNSSADPKGTEQGKPESDKNKSDLRNKDEEKNKEKDKDSKTSSESGKDQSFGIIEPTYIPQGVEKSGISDFKYGEDKAILVRYKGKFNYNIVEVRPQLQTVAVLPGELVDLGFTLGVLTGKEQRTLHWTYQGVDFKLSTSDMPSEEMIKVAMSVLGEGGK